MEIVGGAIHSGRTKNTDMQTLKVGEKREKGLLEKRLHLIEEAVPIGFHGHAALLGVLH